MSTRSFKNPIPPLVLTAGVIVLAFVFRSSTSGLSAQIAWITGMAGYTVACLGVLVMVMAAKTFRQHETTLSPLNLDGVSALVKHGVFRYSRNPMYLGMIALVLGLSLAWVSGWGFMFSVALLIYLDRFQIQPEEQALKAQFGSAFEEYTQNTPRWIGLQAKK